MLKVREDKGVELASAALAHFFVGLIKADAGLSVAEERKVELLIYKMRHGLPGEYEQIIQFLHQIQKDPDYQSWDPDKHGDEGLRYFDKFCELEQNAQQYLDAILDLMEIIVEVGEVTAGEEKFLAKMNREFQKRKGKQ